MLAGVFQKMTVPTFGERLRSLIESKGLNPHGVAVDAKISPSNFYTMLAGRRGPSKGMLEGLANVPELGLSLAELKAWAALDQGAKKTGADPEAVLVHGAKLMRPMPEDMRAMPFAGRVGCGAVLDLEHPEETHPVPAELVGLGDFAVEAEGDSMNRGRTREETINDGDILIIRSSRTAKHGQLVVANLNGDGSTVKRYEVKRKPGGHETAWLAPQSTNPEHTAIRVTEEVHIIGIVVAIWTPPPPPRILE